MMASNQDARPFTDLKKDAEEFRAKFDEDIRECMAYLDGKITDLICDPDSIGSQGKSFKQNALAEFSRAKYDIFISVKSLINTKEREWLNYISEMKKLFIENVEIFLAGTKLEIKLPASEFQPSTGSKKSPGNRRANTSSVTSSIYPLLNTISKSIPVEEDFQFNRRGRLSASSASSVKMEGSQKKFYQKESPDDSDSSDTSRNEIEIENEAMDVDNTEFELNTSQSGSSNRPGKLSCFDLNTSQSSSRRRSNSKKETNSISEQSQKHIPVFGNNIDTTASESVNSNQVATKVRGRQGKLKANTNIQDVNVYPPTSKARGRRGKQIVMDSVMEKDLPQKNSADNNEEPTVPDQISVHQSSSKTRGRRGKQSVINSKSEDVILQKVSSSSDENKIKKDKKSSNQMSLVKRKGRQALKNKHNCAAILQKISSSSDENKIKKAEKSSNQMSLVKRKGKQALKNKLNCSVILHKISISSDENKIKNAEKSSNQLSLVKHRGKQALKNKDNCAVILHKINGNFDENEIKKAEKSSNQIPLVKRRGRHATENKENCAVILQKSSGSSDENEVKKAEEPSNEMPLVKRRGRQATKNKDNSTVILQKSSGSSDENEVKKAEESSNQMPLVKSRGRQATKNKDNSAVILQKSSGSSDENEVKKAEKSSNEMPLVKRRGRQATKILPQANQITENTDDTNEEEPMEKGVNEKLVNGKSATSKNTKNVSVKSAGARSTRGRKAVVEEDTNEPGPSKSPRKVAFSNDDDISDDLDIETPRSTTYTARRKTLLPKLEGLTGADIIPGKPTHSKYKRKTISNVHDLEDVAPPKRLKAGNRKNVSSQEEDNAPDDNFSESDAVPFTNWIPLSSVDGRVPTRPAIYEVKVWRAKKPAYIGSCESLRQKLTLYKLRQNSNHKHLDKFIDRNYDDIQVRYEVSSSLDEAKRAVENRIKSFVEEHKTTPAYN